MFPPNTILIDLLQLGKLSQK